MGRAPTAVLVSPPSNRLAGRHTDRHQPGQPVTRPDWRLIIEQQDFLLAYWKDIHGRTE